MVDIAWEPMSWSIFPLISWTASEAPFNVLMLVAAASLSAARTGRGGGER